MRHSMHEAVARATYKQVADLQECPCYDAHPLCISPFELLNLFPCIDPFPPLEVCLLLIRHAYFCCNGVSLWSVTQGPQIP